MSRIGLRRYAYHQKAGDEWERGSLHGVLPAQVSSLLEGVVVK